MKYRKAEINDIPELIELRKLQLKNYFKKHFLDGSYISWVAEETGEIVANSGVCFYQLPPTFANPSGNIAYITNMFTKYEYRKSRIATDLLKLIIEHSKSIGINTFRLHTSKQGKNIYEKFGFKELEDHMFLINN